MGRLWTSILLFHALLSASGTKSARSKKKRIPQLTTPVPLLDQDDTSAFVEEGDGLNTHMEASDQNEYAHDAVKDVPGIDWNRAAVRSSFSDTEEEGSLADRSLSYDEDQSFKEEEVSPVVTPLDSFSALDDEWVLAEDEDNEDALDEDGFECIDISVPMARSTTGPVKRVIRSTANLIEHIDTNTKPFQRKVGKLACDGLTAMAQTLHDTTIDGLDTIEQIDLKQTAEALLGGVVHVAATLRETPLGRRVVRGASITVSRAKLKMIDTAIAVLSGLRNSLDSAVSTLDEQKVLIDEKLRPYGLPVGEVVALGSDDEIEE